jgi:hypothetical protein
MSYMFRTVRVRARREGANLFPASPSHGIFFLILLGLAFPAYVRGEASGDQIHNSKRLADMVRNLRTRLQITDNVEIQIDEKNDKMVSSEPLAGGRDGYRISFDRHFLDMLDDDEIQAAIAHELGHVWIFSHHRRTGKRDCNARHISRLSEEGLSKALVSSWYCWESRRTSWTGAPAGTAQRHRTASP